MIKIRIRYKKGEEIKYISHLDHMRVLERAIRRADLPVAYSQGFNPRMRISYLTKALKVGESSDKCEADILLEQHVKPQEVKERLNAVLPRGFEVFDASLS